MQFCNDFPFFLNGMSLPLKDLYDQVCKKYYWTIFNRALLYLFEDFCLFKHYTLHSKKNDDTLHIINEFKVSRVLSGITFF